jgi:hypothetical protein
MFAVIGPQAPNERFPVSLDFQGHDGDDCVPITRGLLNQNFDIRFRAFTFRNGKRS